MSTFNALHLSTNVPWYTQKGYRVDWAQSTLGTLLGFDGSGKMHYGSDGGEFATLGGYSSSSTDYAISTITS